MTNDDRIRAAVRNLRKASDQLGQVASETGRHELRYGAQTVLALSNAILHGKSYQVFVHAAAFDRENEKRGQ